MLTQIFKRSLARLQATSPEYIAQLEDDANLYKDGGPDMEISPAEMLPVLLTYAVLFLILLSVRRLRLVRR
jgi:hypothetical protein